jgi:pyruvate dehydrogenase E1 component alpha subunit
MTPTMPTPAASPGAAESTPRPSRPLPAGVAPETIVSWLRDMMLIREFEIRTMQAYQEKKIGGFCHVYIGQEAVAVGCTAAIRPDDPMITAYRDHGHALARGMDPKHCMAEMFGRIGGCAKGKGGSMHMFDRANNLFGGHGIVGAQTPVGAGLAFATKYEDEVLLGGRSRRVTLCFLGDGALNQGALHEAMNLAGLLDLPVIFIVENNGYSMGTAIHRGTTMADNLLVKAAAYGIDAIEVQGMDVVNVYERMKAFADRCRESSRPGFVDLKTYRFKGHSMSDPRKYRTREEEQQYESNDPIGKFRDALVAGGVMGEPEVKAMVGEVREQVREAIRWADASPPPPESELYHDVYVERWGPYTGTSLPEMLQGEGENPGGAR